MLLKRIGSTHNFFCNYSLFSVNVLSYNIIPFSVLIILNVKIYVNYFVQINPNDVLLQHFPDGPPTRLAEQSLKEEQVAELFADFDHITV